MTTPLSPTPDALTALTQRYDELRDGAEKLIEKLRALRAEHEATRAELAASQAEAAGLREAIRVTLNEQADRSFDMPSEINVVVLAALATPTPHATRGAALLRDEARARALRAAIEAAGPLLLRGAYQEALSVLTRAAADDGRALGEYDGMGHGEVKE